MESIAVLKFGGTSVKNIGRVKHVAEIVANYPAKKKLVVVSAMGDTTDYLYGLAKQCSVQPDKRELDLLLSTGEQVSITLLALALRTLGIEAKSCTGPQLGIITDNAHGSARIVDIASESLTRALAENDVVVVAGFQGLGENGEVTTLGRGGSDTTAVAVAAACGASICDIFTDVDGIFTSDPNKIADATLLSRATYEEVLELARAGAQVIHPRAVELAQDYNLRVRVRNTFKPSHEGTVIDGGIEMEKYRTACGVAVDGNLACIALTGVAPTSSAIAELTDLLSSQNAGIENVCLSDSANAGASSAANAGANAVTNSGASAGGNSGANAGANSGAKDISITLRYADADHIVTLLQSIKERTGALAVIPDFDVSKISLVGRGIGGRPELTLRLLSVLDNAKIPIKLVASSENRISCVVAKSEAHRAAQLIHAEFELADTHRTKTAV